MAAPERLRPTRDGDQFHYIWAARRCLELLSGTSDLVAVTVEGSSADEAKDDPIESGEELIDVALYFGSEEVLDARLVRYIQLKHSSRRAHEPWTASGLEQTIKGFAERYASLLSRFPGDQVARRFRFEFTTNRPVESKLKQALVDAASSDPPRQPRIQQSLVRFTGLEEEEARRFFSLFSVEDGEDDLWTQRNLLEQDFSAYLPDADSDAPVQLKELVTRKATTEFESNPSIRRYDVLRALKTSEDRLQPAPCEISDIGRMLAREQEPEIHQAILKSTGPLILHAEGGVGKSVLAARLASSMPQGSKALLYDCFGDGLYRNALHFRHRHQDALVQIANELAALGLCHPLIPSVHADSKAYMRAFVGRISQAIRVLRAQTAESYLYVIIDAADNAEMAAEEQREPASFVRDLIRIPLPEGLRLVFTCRTHRIWRLAAPPGTQQIELRPFSQLESARHLRSTFPSATDAEVAEFAFLSSSNPRVQALALSRGQELKVVLKQLGPEPTTVERAIGELLDAAIEKLRDQVGTVEGSQIDLICQALAVLRPFVPISLLAQLSDTPESAVRSFALDLGRPLLLKGNSVHFLDEPTETWFSERFRPDLTGLQKFLERLRPLAAQSSYAAAALPQLLLRAGKFAELVDIALSGEGLPTVNLLERRDVELQRLRFALKAALVQGRDIEAAKLALKAGGESAGDARQNALLQRNTDLAAILLAPDRVEEIVSRRTFNSGWMGSHHAYDAGILSGRDEFSAEASSRLRMAIEWLHTWARLPEDEREHEERVSDEDRAELTMALLRLRGAGAAARFLRGWTWRPVAFEAGGRVCRRLADLGCYEQIDALAEAAGNDVWLLLGLAVEARNVGRLLPAKPLTRLLRLLSDRRVKLEESQAWDAKWALLSAVCCAVEIALRVLPVEQQELAALLRRYLPSVPPRELTDRYGFDHSRLVRAYTLEFALRGQTIQLIDLAPYEVRKELESNRQYGRSEDAEIFLQEVGGRLPWFILSAEIACGRTPPDLSEQVKSAAKATASAHERNFREKDRLRTIVAGEWLRILQDVGVANWRAAEAEFRSWIEQQEVPLTPGTLISMSRRAARSGGLEAFSLEFAASAYEALESSREDAESRASSYLDLVRAILPVSPAEAGAYFNRAVEVANRIGDENLSRWTALLHLAESAGELEKPRSRTAYRLSRVAELTYEYVDRDKYFDWTATVEALVDLCPSSCLAILSRWRDRRFGYWRRLLPLAIKRLVDRKLLPEVTPIIFAGTLCEWTRLADLRCALEAQPDPAQRQLAAGIAYRYIRLLPISPEECSCIRTLSQSCDVDFPDIDRLALAAASRASREKHEPSDVRLGRQDARERPPDWDAIFQSVDMTSSDALRIAFAAFRRYDPPYSLSLFVKQALLRVSIGREPELIRAIAGWPEFGVFNLRELLASVPKPIPKQIGYRHALRDAVLAACRREPARVQRHGWGPLIRFEDLYKEGWLTDADVIRAMLEGFAARADIMGTSELFALVDPLADRLSHAEADEVLNFGMGLLEDVLRSDDSDGPWSDALQPPQSVTRALAGYIWAGLGSPVLAERWELTHVVRTAAEMGETGLLESLSNWASSDHARPFVDAGLQFYKWHARQWLLIGLARGGLENAAALKACEPLLQRCFREEHVLIRAFAAKALRALGISTGSKSGDVESWGPINRPALAEEVYRGWADSADEEPSPAEDGLDPDEKYYFGIDIRPYWFAPLGRAFGLSEGAIERRVRNVLRQMGWKGGGWKDDARHQRRIFRDSETHHSHGSLPKADDLVVYHSYHGMMFAAAALLRERSVRRDETSSYNDFDEWLSRYLLTRDDWRWLADRRDPRLVDEPPAPSEYRDRLWRWSVSSDYLDKLVETVGDGTVLWGYWRGGDRDAHETVSIRSALVCRAGAPDLLAALQTTGELGRFRLPEAREEDNTQIGSLKLTGWIADQSVPGRLDEDDPWAEGLRYPGPTPTENVIAKLGLTTSADGRHWQHGSESILRCETWTRTEGYGREAETTPGWRLIGTRGFVKRLLETYPEDCLILSVEVRREPPRYSEEENEMTGYPQPYARYFVISEDGVAHGL